MNERWGNNFWSLNYLDWSQIPVPMSFASDLQMKHHPSLLLDFYRFSSDSIVKFCNMQAKILRKYTDKTITTNTDSFLFGDNVNIYNLFKNLDIAGIDIYTSNPHEIAFYSDIARSLKDKSFWMMEYGTGSTRLYEEMKLVKERGCDWFCFFTYKPFKAGQEQGFKGLVTITGEEEPNYFEVQKWAAENKEFTPEPFKAEIGLYYDFDSSWAYSLTSWSDNIVDKQLYPKYIIDTVYRSLFEADRKVQFIFDACSISNYKIVIMPWKLIYEEELEDALIQFVSQGGKLILTTDFFRKNKDNVYLDYLPAFYRKVLHWEKNDFISEDKNSDGFLVYSNKVNSGECVVVKTKASLEEWKKYINKLTW